MSMQGTSSRPISGRPEMVILLSGSLAQVRGGLGGSPIGGSGSLYLPIDPFIK